MKSQEEHPRDRKGWQRIAVKGPLYYKGRHTELTHEDLEAIRKNMIRDVVINKEILVDYEHESEERPKEEIGRVPAAGWIRHPEVEVHPDGLWALVDWTDIGKEDVEKERVKYFSPVIIKNSRDKKTGAPIGAYLKSATVTNIPHIDELQIAATEHPAPEGGDHEEVIVLSMEIKPENKEKGMQKKLAEKLGLPEGATDAQIIEAADKFIQKAGENEKRLNEIVSASGVPPDKIVASMKELKEMAGKKAEGEKSKDTEILALSEKITELEKNDEKREKEISDLQEINKKNEIELLLHEGKIDPSEKEFYLSLRGQAPALYDKKVKELKPKNRDKMPVNVQTVNGEETIVASEGVDLESTKFDRKVKAYMAANKETDYGKAMLAVEEKEKGKNG